MTRYRFGSEVVTPPSVSGDADLHTLIRALGEAGVLDISSSSVDINFTSAVDGGGTSPWSNDFAVLMPDNDFARQVGTGGTPLSVLTISTLDADGLALIPVGATVTRYAVIWRCRCSNPVMMYTAVGGILLPPTSVFLEAQEGGPADNPYSLATPLIDHLSDLTLTATLGAAVTNGDIEHVFCRVWYTP